jgi:hypothetical protein
VKHCPACGSVNVRRSGVHSSEARSHGFRSPYRCQECDTRFWVVSRRARLGAIAAGACVIVIIVIALMSAPPVRYSARVAEPPLVDRATAARSDETIPPADVQRVPAGGTPAVANR